jgi:glycosyltransferase involved in cell wall biosynthesis
MSSGRDIIVISSIEWDFHWQIHQEIAFRFAAHGYRILYVENIGIRAPGLGDVDRVAARLRTWSKTFFSRGVREVSPNIFVTSPIVLPPFGSAVARAINRRLFLPAVKRVVRKMKIRDPLLWTYLPTDTAHDLIRLLASPKSLTIYYCGADFSQLANNPNACNQSEAELIRAADLVFCTCSDLVKKCRRHNPNVHQIPALVDLDAFPLIDRNGQNGNGATPLRAFAKPIIGYVGGLHRLVDYELLTKMARARSDWTWIFVGAKLANPGELANLPNVHLLGQRPHSELADYIREFDVCIVPYLNGSATATVVPLKVNEYLRMGKPVVSTALPTVCEFNDRHGVLITAGNESNSFLKSIEAALSLPRDAPTIERRREVAALGDSEACFKQLSNLIETKLEERAKLISV